MMKYSYFKDLWGSWSLLVCKIEFDFVCFCRFMLTIDLCQCQLLVTNLETLILYLEKRVQKMVMDVLFRVCVGEKILRCLLLLTPKEPWRYFVWLDRTQLGKIDPCYISKSQSLGIRWLMIVYWFAENVALYVSGLWFMVENQMAKSRNFEIIIDCNSVCLFWSFELVVCKIGYVRISDAIIL